MAKRKSTAIFGKKLDFASPTRPSGARHAAVTATLSGEAVRRLHSVVATLDFLRAEIVRLVDLLNDSRPRPVAPPRVAEPSDELALSPQQRQHRALLAKLLKSHRGNIAGVARDLGKERVQIRRWIKKYDLSNELARARVWRA